MAGGIAKALGGILIVLGVTLILLGVAAAAIGANQEYDNQEEPFGPDEDKSEFNQALVVGGIFGAAVGLAGTILGIILIVAGQARSNKAQRRAFEAGRQQVVVGSAPDATAAGQGDAEAADGDGPAPPRDEASATTQT